MDKVNYTEMALKTWYDPDHELYKHPRHPLIKLAGEAGELLDLFGKEEYKPNFSWWRCKICNFMPADKRQSDVDYFAYTCMNGKTHTPLVLDKLGNYSYYLRILLWQQDMSFEKNIKDYQKKDFTEAIELYLNNLAWNSTELHYQWLTIREINKDIIHYVLFSFVAILSLLDCDLDHLMQLNYQKLNSDPTQHGWKR